MRLGLHGQVRRRWTPRGVKLHQKVEIQYVWQYLALVVEPLGWLSWKWLPHMRKEMVAETVQEWRREGAQAVVWDRAPSHRAKIVREIGLPLVEQPAYSPELNPAERVFEEVRRVVEGVVYGDIQKKMAVVESFLRELASDPQRVQRLVGWAWISDALSALPLPNMASD
jgi:transposase